MKNMNDIRNKISEFADEAGVPEKYFIEFMKDFDRIVGDGIEVFEVEGWEGARYVLTQSDAGIWSWAFEDPVEGTEYGDSFETRREAMYSMAQDADNTLVLDTGMGNRIREAI